MIRNLVGALGIWAMIVPILSAQQQREDHHSVFSEKAHHTDQEARSSFGPHGGELQAVGAFRVETVVQPGGVRLFLYDTQGQPIDVSRSRGLAALQIAGDAKRYRYDLFPEVAADQSTTSLTVAVDLSRIAGRQVQLSFQIVGVAGAERKPAQFTATAIVPLTETQHVAAAIEAQKVCPVSGHPLASMGKPIGVKLGEQTVYVCCASCIDTLKANPSKYLAAKPTLTVSKATEADAEAIARQKLCPVMDEPLAAMGGPYKTVVGGRVVYLCCPGCAKKLHGNPDIYFAKLAKQGVTPPAVKTVVGSLLLQADDVAEADW